jgi:hypothetical protein
MNKLDDMRSLMSMLEEIDPEIHEKMELHESYMIDEGTENFRELLIQAIDDGELNAHHIVEMFARWNTSEDIQEMLLANDIFIGSGYNPNREDDEDDMEETYTPPIATSGVRG